MEKYLSTILTIILAAVPAIGQSKPQPVSAATSIQTEPGAVPAQPSLIDSIKKTIVFLETDCVITNAEGQQALKPYSGTAFLVAVPDKRLGEGKVFTYLVTNRHVAQPGSEEGHPCQPFRYIIRADLRNPKSDGSYSDVGIIPSNQVTWTVPTDDSVDLAVTPIGLDANMLDVIFLPSTLLMTSDEIKSQHVEEGDSVLFSGLFVQLIGQTHSEPIVREGKIAMMPKEPVPTTLRKIGDLYLVDCHVFGGNSGSPMFINLAGQRQGSMIVGVNYRLLGVVSGYMKETSDFSLQTVASYAGTMDANSGIATVVPAQKLIDLLNSPVLIQLRDKAVVAASQTKLSPEHK
jgi:hypothetical protein